MAQSNFYSLKTRSMSADPLTQAQMDVNFLICNQNTNLFNSTDSLPYNYAVLCDFIGLGDGACKIPIIAFDGAFVRNNRLNRSQGFELTSLWNNNFVKTYPKDIFPSGWWYNHEYLLTSSNYSVSSDTLQCTISTSAQPTSDWAIKMSYAYDSVNDEFVIYLHTTQRPERIMFMFYDNHGGTPTNNEIILADFPS